MSRIRFPNDDLVNKLMRRQDRFWRKLYKKQAEQKQKEAEKKNAVRK